MYLQDIIDILLQKKATLREEIEREFRARSEKIEELLKLAGYVEPQVTEIATETVTETVETIPATMYQKNYI